MTSTRQPPALAMPHVAVADAAAASLLSGSSGLLLPDRPPIAALFLIEFDVKAGYTIVWKQAARGLDLTGAVEYKSLPSGLHAVSEDLIYFVHEDDQQGPAAAPAAPGQGGFAGLSAFVNLPTDEADARYARMIAVGVLVPRSYGRLGRAWRHAEALMAMARKLAADRNETPLLEEYWRIHNGLSTAGPAPLLPDSPLSSPTATLSFRSPQQAHAAHTRSASDGAALLLPGHHLSPHHPAWSLTSLLDTFGPLVFPIYRAALLRKRILISTQAPVREVNNFVYNISVLANIPISVLDILDHGAAQQRIRPLFTIGVNDIPFLAQDYAAAKRAAADREPFATPGWVACTTDSILATRGELWDVLITMPTSTASTANLAAAPGASSKPSAADKKVWPTVEVAKGVPVKATQRDLRRFLALRAGLERLGGSWAASGRGDDETNADDADAASESASLLARRVPKIFLQPDAQVVDTTESVVEPVTWAALAYNGFMWWASAGEQRRAEDAEESIQDASLLTALGPGTLSPSMQRPPQPVRPEAGGEEEEEEEEGDDEADEDEDRARVELAIIAYFHRLTTQMLSVVADIVESSEGEEDEEEDGAGDLINLAHDEADEGDDATSSDALLNGGRQRRRHVGGSGGHSGSDARSGRPLSGDTAAGATTTTSTTAGGSAVVHINSEALTRMGLDVWSQADAAFVRDLVQQYFGRQHGVQVEGKGIEVCGLKIC